MTACDVIERKLRDGMQEGQMHGCLRDVGRLAGGYAATGALSIGDLMDAATLAAQLSVNANEGREKFEQAVAFGRGQPIDWNETEYQPRESKGLEWDSEIGGGSSEPLKVIDSNWLQDEEVTEPKHWNPKADLIKYLSTLFQGEEHVAYTTESWEKDGKFLPTSGCSDRTAAKLITELQKASESQHIDNEPTNMKWRAEKIVMPTVPVTRKIRPYVKACGSLFVAKGITSGVRGLHHKNADTKIRPDFVILDDPQTRESARSFEQTATRERIIRGDVMGLAGHDRVISGVMPCTVIEKDDLADKFLNRTKNPEWRGHKTKLVYAWGQKSTVKGSKHEYANGALWEAYHELWEAGKLSGDMTAADSFYRKNRKEMDDGVVVASEHFYDRTSEVSSIQHAFHLLFKVKEPAFLAEYQNEPPGVENADYHITADDVRNALNHLPHRVAPNEAQYLTCVIDINDLGLNWSVVAFDKKRAGWILDYGKYTGGRKALWSKAIAEQLGLTEEQAVYQGVTDLGKLLHRTEYQKENGTPLFMDAIAFDANYMTDTVTKACKALSKELSYKIWLSRSRPTKRYRVAKGASVLKTANGVHLEETARCYELIYPSDRWQLNAQQGFLLPPGSPLSLSLYGSNPQSHDRIADEISSEKLLQLLRGDVHDSYTWSLKIGARNDLLDTVKGCIAAAALLGAGQATEVKKKRRRKKAGRVASIKI